MRSFGTNGIVTTAIGSGNDYIRSVAIQSDGKIVVAGNSYNGTNDDFAVIRYNTNGSLDILDAYYSNICFPADTVVDTTKVILLLKI